MGKGIPYRNNEGFKDPTPWQAMNNILDEERAREQQHARNMMKGAQNRMSGNIFERQIMNSLSWHAEHGIMKVEKTPEPMKPIKPMDKGRFIACYTKPAQVDFSGTLYTGRAIRFEAKQTDTDRFRRDRLTEEQMADLEAHYQLNAYCCVIICFGLDRFYRIPWIIWREMKAAFGHMYITEEDVHMFRLPFEQGIIKLTEKTEAETIFEERKG